MYFETLRTGITNPKQANQTLNTHFFKPYRNPCDLVGSLLSPVDAIFSDSVPNIFHTILLIGTAVINAVAGVGNLLLARGKKAIDNFTNTGAALFFATVSAALIVLAPLFEAIRFFTRWGATVADSFAQPIIKEEAPAASPSCGC